MSNESERKNGGQGRRDFLKLSATAGAMALGSSCVINMGQMGENINKSPQGAPSKSRESLIPNGGVVLFQGDSITDAGRAKGSKAPNNSGALGRGYASLIAARLLANHPGENLKIYNRGISGHKVPQLAARWEEDCLDIAPDVLSILIGVNDIWHMLNKKYEGTLEDYLKGYDELVQRTRDELPFVRLVICEPFVLRCGAVNDNWFPLFDEYRQAARRVAKKHGARWVPFQDMFNKALRYAPPEYWAADGVHPSVAGAELMAREWLKAVGEA